MAWRLEFRDFNKNVYGEHPVWVDKTFDTYSELVGYMAIDAKIGDKYKGWCQITITHEDEGEKNANQD